MKKNVCPFVLISFLSIIVACQDTNVVIPHYEDITSVMNVENSYIQTYMSTNNATFSDEPSLYHSSSAFEGTNPDQPNSFPISFTSNGKQNVRLIVYRGLKRDTLVLDSVLTLTGDSGKYELTNFVPGCTYRYAVTSSVDTLVAGTIHTTGQVRQISINHGFNIRDLGGWTGWNGNTVRYEALYRGGSLGGGMSYNGTRSDDFPGVYSIDEHDRQELLRLGIRAELDLRAVYRSGMYNDAGEVSYHAYSTGERPLGPGTDFCNIQTDYGAYILDASLIWDMAWIIYELRQGKPVYFNCHQGADRTGALAFLIEGLLGCDKYSTKGGGNQLAMDYEMTGFSQSMRSDNHKESTCRPASSVYENERTAFYKLIDYADELYGDYLDLQDRCYYFLNQSSLDYYRGYTNTEHQRYITIGQTDTEKVKNDPICGISSEDLDWFINYMLGITDREGNVLNGKTPFTAPSWALPASSISGYNLKTMAEKNANSVQY